MPSNLENKNKSDATKVQATELPKTWLENWFIQSIFIAVLLKVFGVLGGLCGLCAFFYIKKIKSTGVALVSAFAVSLAAWAIASSLLNS